MRLYVIGPVTGRPSLNREEFEEARKALAMLGFEVDIPHDYVPGNATWERAMRISLWHLAASDGDGPLYAGAVRLPGWRESKGAALEDEVARACGIPAKDLADWLDPSAPAAAGGRAGRRHALLRRRRGPREGGSRRGERREEPVRGDEARAADGGEVAMAQKDKPKRRPSIEVRCPKCGVRETWHHLPKGGDRCRWCGHLFEDFTYRKVGPGSKEGAE